jgi:hypothetical protein
MQVLKYAQKSRKGSALLWRYLVLLAKAKGKQLCMIAKKSLGQIHVFIVHYFSSVAYVWVRGAKTTVPIVKKFGFS